MYDIKKHLAALSSAKWDEWKAELANDAIYEEAATHVRVKGADDYLKIVQRWKRAFPDLQATVLDSAMTGNKVFAEVEWEGTQTGPLEGPFGMIAPTHKHGVVKASMIVTVKNDKIVELHHYFDMVTMLSNLGLVPFAGLPAAAPAKAGAAATPRNP